MPLTVVISVLAILQFWFFGMLVGNARTRYGVAAPAITGNEMFERYFRVQMNTLELLVMFLPALWLASRYVAPLWTALLGVLYLIGRFVYWRGYIAAPSKRGPGFGLSALPILLLLLISLVGAIMQWVRFY